MKEKNYAPCIMRCDWCGKENMILENWGDVHFCHATCANTMRNLYAKPHDTCNIIIGTSWSFMGLALHISGAVYFPLGGAIGVYALSIEFEELLMLINHEYIHFVLHKIIGIQCCFQYDNVYEQVDDYHSEEDTEER